MDLQSYLLRTVLKCDSSIYWLDIITTILQGTAVCDFSGSSYEVYGNCNAPRAVTLSALIYCLRCMVGHDIPLNQVGIT